MCKALKRQGERYKPYRSRIPAGRAGPWAVERFKVAIDLQNLRMVCDGRVCSPGTFTRLCHDKRGVVMSDTDAEIEDFLPFVRQASGSVLVAGLGLGCVTQALLAKDGVERVTVIEIDRDVISLVAPHLQDARLKVVHGDAFKWRPPRGARYQFGWYDVWDDICGDNLGAIRKMKARFRQWVAWASAWCEDEVWDYA
jgi:hypothetical protein